MASRMCTKAHTTTGTHAASGHTWTHEHKNEREARQSIAYAIADNLYGSRAYATRYASAAQINTPLEVPHEKTGAPALTVLITITPKGL